MARRKRWGQGSVTKRSGKFRARLCIDGQRLAETFETERSAWDWIGAQKADALRGRLGIEVKTHRPALTFGDLARAFLIHRGADWKPGSADYYKHHLSGVLFPAFEDRFVSDLTPLVIQGWLNGQLQRTSSRSTSRPVEEQTTLTAGTVRKYYQILRAIFAFGVAAREIPENPMDGVKPPRWEPKSSRPLLLHEVQAVLRACLDHERAFWLTLSLTGLRRSEVFRMTWDWVDFDLGVLHVRDGKTSGAHALPLAAALTTSLRALGSTRDGLVFPSASGGRGWGREKSMRSLLKRAGVKPEGVTMHSFRHTFGTLLEDLCKGSVVQQLMRHSKLSKAITYWYLHPRADELRAAVESLATLILSPAKIVPIGLAARD